jgi:hypothetical protein
MCLQYGNSFKAWLPAVVGMALNDCCLMWQRQHLDSVAACVLYAGDNFNQPIHATVQVFWPLAIAGLPKVQLPAGLPPHAWPS